MLRTRTLKTTFVLMIASLVGILAFQFSTPSMAGACGYNNSGGEGYAPQRRDTGRFFSKSNRPTMTEKDARKIVSKHVTRLNPELKVGQVVDNGAYYEAEVTNKEERVIQIVGVDKDSGRLLLIN